MPNFKTANKVRGYFLGQETKIVIGVATLSKRWMMGEKAEAG